MLNLHKVYRDICRGYSSVTWDKSPLYVKHLDNFDQGEIDDYYTVELAKAIKIGLPTLEEKTQWLEGQKLWSSQDDRDLLMQRDYIKNAEVTKQKQLTRSMMENYEKVLVPERARLAEMVAKKEKLFGLTAEKFALQKVQFFYIYIALYSDPQLAARRFSLYDVDNLDEDDSYDLLHLYIESMEDLSLKNIKHIAISNFFTNQFYICGEDIYSFFCRPVSQLTTHQTNLLGYGLYFKQLMQSEQIPPHLRDDPEAIEDFIQRSQNMKEQITKRGKDGDNVAIIGASDQDLKDLGGREQSAGMKEALRKGVSNINDAMKLVGTQ